MNPVSKAHATKSAEDLYPSCEYTFVFCNGYEKVLAKAKKPDPKIVSKVEFVIPSASYWDTWTPPERYDDDDDEDWIDVYELKDLL